MTEHFSGFDVPKSNYSKLPHQLIDALPLVTSLAELKVLLYVLRHTWGFQEFDHLKRITLDEFRNGRKRRDGTRFDNGTGMSVNAIKDGVRRAIEHGFLIQAPDGRDPARSSHVYQLRVSKVDTQETYIVSTSDGRVSTSDTQPSKVDTRSEKDTLERNPRKKAEDSLWICILDQLRLQMTQATFDANFACSTLEHANGTYRIHLRHEFAKANVESRLADLVTRTIGRLSGEEDPQVEFVVSEVFGTSPKPL